MTLQFIYFNSDGTFPTIQETKTSVHIKSLCSPLVTLQMNQTYLDLIKTKLKDTILLLPYTFQLQTRTEEATNWVSCNFRLSLVGFTVLVNQGSKLAQPDRYFYSINEKLLMSLSDDRLFGIETEKKKKLIFCAKDLFERDLFCNLFLILNSYSRLNNKKVKKLKKLKKKSKKNEATMNKALDLKSQTSPEISNKIKKEIHSNDPLEKIQRKAEFQSGALPPQSIEKMSIKLEKLLKKYFFSITSRLILPSLVTTNSIERKIQIPSPSMFSYRTQPLQTYQEGSINRDQARHESYNLINQSTIQERSTLGYIGFQSTIAHQANLLNSNLEPVSRVIISLSLSHFVLDYPCFGSKFPIKRCYNLFSKCFIIDSQNRILQFIIDEKYYFFLQFNISNQLFGFLLDFKNKRQIYLKNLDIYRNIDNTNNEMNNNSSSSNNNVGEIFKCKILLSNHYLGSNLNSISKIICGAETFSKIKNKKLKKIFSMGILDAKMILERDIWSLITKYSNFSFSCEYSTQHNIHFLQDESRLKLFINSNKTQYLDLQFQNREKILQFETAFKQLQISYLNLQSFFLGNLNSLSIVDNDQQMNKKKKIQKNDGNDNDGEDKYGSTVNKIKKKFNNQIQFPNQSIKHSRCYHFPILILLDDKEMHKNINQKKIKNGEMKSKVSSIVRIAKEKIRIASKSFEKKFDFHLSISQVIAIEEIKPLKNTISIKLHNSVKSTLSNPICLQFFNEGEKTIFFQIIKYTISNPHYSISYYTQKSIFKERGSITLESNNKKINLAMGFESDINVSQNKCTLITYKEFPHLSILSLPKKHKYYIKFHNDKKLKSFVKTFKGKSQIRILLINSRLNLKNQFHKINNLQVYLLNEKYENISKAFLSINSYSLILKLENDQLINFPLIKQKQKKKKKKKKTSQIEQLQEHIQLDDENGNVSVDVADNGNGNGNISILQKQSQDKELEIQLIIDYQITNIIKIKTPNTQKNLLFNTFLEMNNFLNLLNNRFLKSKKDKAASLLKIYGLKGEEKAKNDLEKMKGTKLKKNKKIMKKKNVKIIDPFVNFWCKIIFDSFDQLPKDEIINFIFSLENNKPNTLIFEWKNNQIIEANIIQRKIMFLMYSNQLNLFQLSINFKKKIRKITFQIFNQRIIAQLFYLNRIFKGVDNKTNRENIHNINFDYSRKNPPNFPYSGYTFSENIEKNILKSKNNTNHYKKKFVIKNSRNNNRNKNKFSNIIDSGEEI
ncbi:hypothetical protein M0812_02741 [Anaeramoeba flamelloides]|uniref:Uncharacterized protein n=1 Tax=Anaeramoeba flamelloides TaxID=1746091 RepID=A0AAV7YT22_9EUKA|nr:hypothetical protein M0812_02741 [Anaeramoeba flamelloides]